MFDGDDPNRFESDAVAVAWPTGSGHGGEGGFDDLHYRGTQVVTGDMTGADPPQRAPVLAGSGYLPDVPCFCARREQAQQPRRSTSRSRLSRVAANTNSSVKPVRKSVSLRMSSRSIMPHRRCTSALSAAKLRGSGSYPASGTLIHGCPLQVVTCTSPLASFTIAASRRSRASRCGAAGRSRNEPAPSLAGPPR